jgi:hypothetical protein
MYDFARGEHNYQAMQARMTEQGLVVAERQLEVLTADNFLRNRLELVERKKKRLTDQYNEYVTGPLQKYFKEAGKA